jgi:hypothetical protein
LWDLTSDFWAVFEEKSYKGNKQKDKSNGKNNDNCVGKGRALLLLHEKMCRMGHPAGKSKGKRRCSFAFPENATDSSSD